MEASDNAMTTEIVYFFQNFINKVCITKKEKEKCQNKNEGFG